MVDDGWEDKKESMEEDAKDFPENTANWTGEKVHLTLPTLPLGTKYSDTNSMIGRRSRTSPRQHRRRLRPLRK